MGQIAIYEQAAPVTPLEGNVLYTTVAAPSILRVKNDAGVDLPITTTITGTFTPGLRFGGGATGMTFTQRNGRYVKHGPLVTVHIDITLSAKGSSTGNAEIYDTGSVLSGMGAALTPSFFAIRGIAMTTAFVLIGVEVSTTGGFFYVIGATAAATDLAALTHADFSNTTTIRMCACYMVA